MIIVIQKVEVWQEVLQQLFSKNKVELHVIQLEANPPLQVKQVESQFMHVLLEM